MLAMTFDPTPPVWCIEMEKWPYNTVEWKRWLADFREGKNPQLPTHVLLQLVKINSDLMSA
jgi:hypothetical protein